MKEIHPNDWTLVASKQREEERRTKEQDDAPLVSPNDETQRNNEALRSDWTIAALQKRFTALETRLAALEQGEEERRRKERVDAARVPPREEKQLVAPIERDDKRRSIEQPEFAEAKVEHQLAEAASRANERWLQRDESGAEKHDERESLRRDHIDIRPVRSRSESVHIGAAHKVARGFLSAMIAASIAGALGFGTGIYVVPIEKAALFHALVKRGLNSIYEGHSSQER